MGGVDPAELVVATLLLLGTLAFFGSIGLWASAVFRTSRAATAFAYAVSGLFTLGLPILTLFASPLMGSLALNYPSLVQQPPPWLLYTGELLAATNPWLTAGLTEAQFQSGLPLLWLHETVSKTNLDVPGPWLLFLVLYAGGTWLCFHATARALKRRRAGG